MDGRVVESSGRTGGLVVAGLALVALVGAVAVLGGDDGAGEAAPVTTTASTTTSVVTTTSAVAATTAPTTTARTVLLPTDVPESVRGMRLTVWSGDLSRSTQLVVGESEAVTTEHESVTLSVGEVWRVRTGVFGTTIQGQRSVVLPAGGGAPLVLDAGVDSPVVVGDDIWAQSFGSEGPSVVELDPTTGEVVRRLETGHDLAVVGAFGDRPLVVHWRAGRYGTVQRDGTVTFVGWGQPVASGPGGAIQLRCDDGPVCTHELVRPDGSTLDLADDLLPTDDFLEAPYLGAETAILTKPDSGTDVVVDLADGSARPLELSPRGEHLFVSPDGRVVATVFADSVWIHLLDGSDPVRLEVGQPVGYVVIGPGPAG